MTDFNPPAPCEAGLRDNIAELEITSISIHPPHARRDGLGERLTSFPGYFNPPAPCEAGLAYESHAIRQISISIHPPHARRDRYCEVDVDDNGISIHPPRAGRDLGGPYIVDPSD